MSDHTELEAAEPQPRPPRTNHQDGWQVEFDRLRQRFPKANDGTLFALFKLQSDPGLKLEDIRYEAELLGLNLTGGSMRSARSMLGMIPRQRRRAYPSPSSMEEPEEGSPDWPAVKEELAAQFPRVKDTILFCVWKLRRNPDLRLPDIRDEAESLGLKIGGRSLHSARHLLATDREPASPRSVEAYPAREQQPAAGEQDLTSSVIAAFQRLQDEATADVKRLRRAIEEAIAILSVALSEE